MKTYRLLFLFIFVFYNLSFCFAYEVTNEEIDYWIKEVNNSPTSFINTLMPEYPETKELNCYIKITEFPYNEIKALADNGNVKCQFLMGIWLYSHDGRRANNDLAAKYLKKAADNGDKKSKLFLCHMSIRGLTEEISNSKAKEFIEKCIEKGSVKAIPMLGDYYCKMDDLETAMEYYKKAANLGDSKAMYALHKIYYYSNNFSESQKWLDKAYEANNKTAVRKKFLKFLDNQDLLNDNKNRKEAFDIGQKLSELQQETGAILFLYKGSQENNSDIFEKGKTLLQTFISTDTNNEKYLTHQISCKLFAKIHDFENALIFHKKETEKHDGLVKDILNLIDLQFAKDFDNLPIAIKKVMNKLDEKELAKLDEYRFNSLLQAIINYYVFLCETNLSDFNYSRDIYSKYKNKKHELSEPYFTKTEHIVMGEEKKKTYDSNLLISILGKRDKNVTVLYSPIEKEANTKVLTKLKFLRDENYKFLEDWYKHTEPYINYLTEWQEKLKICIKKIKEQKLIHEEKINTYISCYKEFYIITDKLKKSYYYFYTTENADVLLDYLSDRVKNYQRINQKNKVFFNVKSLWNEQLELSQIAADFGISFYKEWSGTTRNKFNTIFSYLKDNLEEEEYEKIIKNAKYIYYDKLPKDPASNRSIFP